MSTAPVWKVKFYGVRGSIPVCHPDYGEFGGNTTCFHLDLLRTPLDEKVTVIFDAGTGIRQLGKDIENGVIPKAEYILIQFSHFHWDHIQGFPFFAPAYFEGQNIVLFSPHYLDESATKLKEIFDLQMQSEYFPVQLNKVGANVRFHTNAEQFKQPLNMDVSVDFRYHKHSHPGDAFSYRLDGYGKSVVFCTDLEHGETIDEAVVEFCRDADLLIHDAQYTDEELKSHRGWGHSSFSQAIEVAERADVKQLYLTHHDPDHDDAFLRRIEKECQRRFPNCHFAREGAEVVV
ncbi:MAG: MBL fold metallo-hydrolase [Bacteroidota bacterium]